MAVFAVSFRLGDGPNYAARWQALDESVRAHANGPVYDEPTSLYVFKSSTNATDLCGSIFNRARMDSRVDTLVVVNLSAKDHQMLGSRKASTLNDLMIAR